MRGAIAHLNINHLSDGRWRCTADSPRAGALGAGREQSPGGNGIPSYRQGKCRPFNIPLCKPRDINEM